MKKRSLQAVGVLFILAVALIASFVLADYVQENNTAQVLVERFGYFGMLIISIISGLNILVPIPAATFTPIYTAAGFPLFSIVAVLVIGTVIADTIGYLIGVGGRNVAQLKYPALQTRLQTFAERHHVYLLPLVFLWVSFAPLPNEVVIIPLALIGVRFRVLIIPLILGTIVHQTLFAYGVTSIFEYFF